MVSTEGSSSHVQEGPHEVSSAAAPADHEQAPEQGNLLARFVGLNVIGTAGTGAIGFVASIVLARWLGPSERGVLAVMLSVSSLALFVGGIGVPWAMVYYAQKRDPRALFGNSLLLAAVLAAVLVPAAWLLRQPLADAFAHGEGGMTWVLAAALVPVTFLDWTSHSQMQGMLLFGRFNALSVVAKLAETLWIVLLLGVFKVGVSAGVSAAMAGSTIMIIGALKPILANGRPRLDLPLLGTLLRYGSRAQVGSIFQQAIARVDVLILQLFRPLSQVGYYVVAQVVAEIVLRLTVAFQSSVMSLLAHYDDSERQASTDASADAVRHHGILIGLACIGNAVAGAAIILVAYGSEYRPAVVPMLVLLPGIWFVGTAGVIRSDLSGRGLPGLASKLAGWATAVTLIGDFALIPPLGVIGAALASTISYTMYGVISLMALHRVSGIPARRLLVPTRADFAIYGQALKQAAERFRR